MGEKSDPELDEIDVILGAITNGNSHSEEPGFSNFPRICGPNSVSSSNGSLIEKNHTNGVTNDGKISGNIILQSPIQRVSEGRNLPDDQSLASAFSALSFSHGVTVDNANHTCGVYPFLPTNAAILDGQCQNNLKKHPSIMDPRVIGAPLQSPYDSAGGFDKNTHEYSHLSRFDFQDLKTPQANHSQSFENFSGTVPFAHEVQGFQYFSDMSNPHVEYPLVADQQQYFLNANSQLQYLHPQQLNQPHFIWNHGEDEQYYRMYHQYLYWQQLQKQILEADPQVQASENAPRRLVSRNQIQPYYRMQVPGRQECYQKPYWNSFSAPRCLNQSNSVLSSAEDIYRKSILSNFTASKCLNQTNYAISSNNLKASHHLEKLGKQNFPEKILTRSHGLNAIKSAKFGSLGGNESPIIQNGRAPGNDNSCHSFSSPNGHRLLDSTVLQSLSQETADIDQTVPIPQPHTYNLLDEACGKIYLMAKDQNGCRFLQKKFSDGTPEEVDKIFEEIKDHIVELMIDPFGNYLVQKLLEVCDEDQLMQILRAITWRPGDLVEICCDVHGTRAVQKVIETLKTPEQFSMVVSSLKPGIVNLIKDMNGNHVVQRCLQYLMPEYSKFLFEAASANCLELATDPHGCCVLQKCLGHSDSEQRRRLIHGITSSALILSQDPFGNYVVQYVFELQISWAIRDIIDQLQGNYADLSMQKCSSNVVEKCLKYAGEERRSSIIQELISNPQLDRIMQDPYGNYVIQSALNLSKGAIHTALVEAIRPHIPVLRTSPYGKKVLSSYSLKK